MLSRRRHDPLPGIPCPELKAADAIARATPEPTLTLQFDPVTAKRLAAASSAQVAPGDHVILALKTYCNVFEHKLAHGDPAWGDSPSAKPDSHPLAKAATAARASPPAATSTPSGPANAMTVRLDARLAHRLQRTAIAAGKTRQHLAGIAIGFHLNAVERPPGEPAPPGASAFEIAAREIAAVLAAQGGDERPSAAGARRPIPEPHEPGIPGR